MEIRQAVPTFGRQHVTSATKGMATQSRDQLIEEGRMACAGSSVITRTFIDLPSSIRVPRVWIGLTMCNILLIIRRSCLLPILPFLGVPVPRPKMSRHCLHLWDCPLFFFSFQCSFLVFSADAHFHRLGVEGKSVRRVDTYRHRPHIQ